MISRAAKKFHVVTLACSPEPCSVGRSDSGKLLGRARDAGALVLLYGRIHKMSTLVQWAKVQIVDVRTDTLVLDRFLTFRGDDERAWQRAEAFLAADLEQHDLLDRDRERFSRIISKGATVIETIDIVRTIDVPSIAAWEAIRGIGGLDRWFPVIATCRVEGEGVGAIRTLGLVQGGAMKDRIEEIDDAARRFRYLRFDHPLPATSYKGTVVVRGVAGGKSEVTWSVEIDVEAQARDGLVAFVGKALSDGIAGLGEDLRSRHAAS